MEGELRNIKTSPLSESYEGAEILQELKLIHQACFEIGLPRALQRTVNQRGRRPFSRFILITLIIYGLQRGWSYRQISEFSKNNLDLLREIDPALKKEPSHIVLYRTSQKITAGYIMRVMAKVKELAGLTPCLPY